MTMSIEIPRVSFVPTSRHLQPSSLPLNGSPDRDFPDQEEDCHALAVLDGWWLAIEREELQEAWNEHYRLRTCLARLTRYATTRAHEGDPSLLMAIEEFHRQCPNPPPNQRICVSNPWG